MWQLFATRRDWSIYLFNISVRHYFRLDWAFPSPSSSSGPRCETEIDECESNPCFNGICDDLVGDFKCECFDGYYGRLCEYDFDECDSNPCRNAGTCQNLQVRRCGRLFLLSFCLFLFLLILFLFCFAVVFFCFFFLCFSMFLFLFVFVCVFFLVNLLFSFDRFRFISFLFCFYINSYLLVNPIFFPPSLRAEWVHVLLQPGVHGTQLRGKYRRLVP